MYRLNYLCLSLVLLADASAQTSTSKSAPKGAPAATAKPQFKAIWERVNFQKDLGLSAISCTGAEMCWAAGDKSTIVHTKDGGKTWQVQLGGDTEASDEGLREIFFLDSTHGWALTERSRFMQTTDGSNWVELAKLRSLSKSVWFTTPQTGFVLENSGSTTQSTMHRTADGGKSWKPVHKCTVETSIGGLARKLECMMTVVRFVSPAAGFLAGGAAGTMGTAAAAFGKTTDGGETWKTSVIPDTTHKIVDLLFWSDQQGLAVLDSGKTYWTADGGETWTGSVNPPQWKSFYGQGGGKIIAAVQQGGAQIGYSFNGGRNFSSRQFGLPAQVRDVTFFDAQNGYLVGEHGMAYRYRIVPIEYFSPGMIGAAAPPQ